MSDYIWRHVGRNRMSVGYSDYLNCTTGGWDEFSLDGDKRVWVVTYEDRGGVKCVAQAGAPFSKYAMDTERFMRLDAVDGYDDDRDMFTVRVPVSLFVRSSPIVGTRVLGKLSKYYQQCLSLALYAQMMIDGEATKSFPWWRKTGSIDREYER